MAASARRGTAYAAVPHRPRLSANAFGSPVSRRPAILPPRDDILPEWGCTLMICIPDLQATGSDPASRVPIRLRLT